MIDALYPEYQRWAECGSVWIIADTHFDDTDCRWIDPEWPEPAEHVRIIRQSVHPGDTLIHLGDVGSPEWMDSIRAHKVLIMGNHDQSIRRFEPFFDEIYSGPLIIGKKLLLSHEPIKWLGWCVNIHGHEHGRFTDWDINHINLAADVVKYCVFNLGWFIRNGGVADVKDIHRITIDAAAAKNETEGYME